MDLIFFSLKKDLSLIILMPPALPLHSYKTVFVCFFVTCHALFDLVLQVMRGCPF